jgi:hypothetical protein
MGFRARHARDAKTEASEENPTKMNITALVKGTILCDFFPWRSLRTWRDPLLPFLG